MFPAGRLVHYIPERGDLAAVLQPGCRCGAGGRSVKRRCTAAAQSQLPGFFIRCAPRFATRSGRTHERCSDSAAMCRTMRATMNTTPRTSAATQVEQQPVPGKPSQRGAFNATRTPTLDTSTRRAALEGFRRAAPTGFPAPSPSQGGSGNRCRAPAPAPETCNLATGNDSAQQVEAQVPQPLRRVPIHTMAPASAET